MDQQVCRGAPISSQTSAAHEPLPVAVAEFAESRAAIEQAKGMLVLVYGVDDESAFNMLRQRSQNTNTKLRVLAELVGGRIPRTQ